MKKIILSAVVGLMLFSCQNDQNESTNEVDSAIIQRKCATQDVLQDQLQEDPTLAIRMSQIEAFTENALLTKRLVNGKIEIPVVVNVLYRTASENVSDAQIQSQIDILNKDMKKANRGGLAPISPTTKLNIWVCTIGGGILGYAQFPGGSSATDGVVIDSRYFGLSGSANAPYNLGRTATHEVGHWMNLRHIWGDAACGSDLVSDTPTHNAPNYGDPAFPHYSTCTGTPVEMTMNYMDYTDDNAMYMFSIGQKSRISAIFIKGGPRSAFGI